MGTKGLQMPTAGTDQHRVLAAIADGTRAFPPSTIRLATGLGPEAVAVASARLVERGLATVSNAKAPKDRRLRVTYEGRVLAARLGDVQPLPEARRRLPVVTDEAPATRLIAMSPERRIGWNGRNLRRDDCANEGACLDEFNAAHPKGDRQAKCPKACPHFVKAEPLSALAFTSSGISNAAGF